MGDHGACEEHEGSTATYGFMLPVDWTVATGPLPRPLLNCPLYMMLAKRATWNLCNGPACRHSSILVILVPASWSCHVVSAMASCLSTTLPAPNPTAFLGPRSSGPAGTDASAHPCL